MKIPDREKKIRELQETIYNLDDFPTFQYCNFNSRKFEPRKLNQLSTNFNWILADRLLRLVEDEDPSSTWEIGYETEEELFNWLVFQFLFAINYAYYFNASYEAMGCLEGNTCCGGDGSIQESFICWALDIPVERYRDKKTRPYLSYSTMEDYDLTPLKDWLKQSKLWELFKGYWEKYKEIVDIKEEMVEALDNLYRSLPAITKEDINKMEVFIEDLSREDLIQQKAYKIIYDKIESLKLSSDDEERMLFLLDLILINPEEGLKREGESNV